MTRTFTIINHNHHKLDFKNLSINDVITIIEILYNILKLKRNIYYCYIYVKSQEHSMLVHLSPLSFLM